MLFARTKACLLTGYWAETQTWEITNTSTEVNSCVYEQHTGDTPSTSVIVDSDYEMKSVPQTEHLGSATSTNQNSDDMSERAKGESLLKA